MTISSKRNEEQEDKRNESSDTQIGKFKLLVDQPLEATVDPKDRKFGHADIASALSDLCENAPTPFTVGLFGKWGSGKSTIINSLQALLIGRKVPVVIFDVWKHEGDSLRRTFLKELVYQLKKSNSLDKKFVLNDRLEHSLSKNQDGRLKIDKGKIWSVLLIVGTFVLFLIVGKYLSARLGVSESTYIEYSKMLLTFIVGGGFILWLFNAAVNLITTETTTFSYEKLQDPHEFEAEFGRVLESVSEDRLVIVFDNLDRVAHERALEALTTIKTFLEPRDKEVQHSGVVFLIPCDDKAIRAHIASVYGVNHKDGNANIEVFNPEEFLRKFFNAVIWIPDFILSELEAFSRECLRKTEVTELDDDVLSWLITRAFRENPRQVIQFTNILVSNYILIVQREGEGKDFELGFAARNKREICLYLLLTHLYPTAMQELRSRGITSLKDGAPSDAGTEVSMLLKFYGEVSAAVQISNLRTFYALRRSDQERLFPGIDQFFDQLEDNLIDGAKKQAITFEHLVDRVEDFSLAIKNHFGNMRNALAKTHFIHGLLQVIEDRHITLTTTCYAPFHLALTSSEFSETLDIVSPRVLYTNMLSKNSDYTTEMMEKWLERIEVFASGDEKLRKSKGQFIYEVFHLVAEFPTLLPDKQRIQQLLKGPLGAELGLVALFTASPGLQKELFGPEFLDKFVDAISERDLAKPSSTEAMLNLPIRWKILGEFDTEIISSKALALVISKFEAILTTRGALPWTEDLKRDRNLLFAFLRQLFERFEALIEPDVPLQTFGNALMTNLNAIPDWSNRREALPLLGILVKRLGEPYKAQVNTFIEQLFVNSSAADIEYWQSDTSSAENLLVRYPQASILEQRGIREPALFELLYPSIAEVRQSTWLTKLLTSDSIAGLNRLASLKYVVPDERKIVETVIQVAKSLPLSKRKPYYAACNQMKFDNDQELISALVAELIALLSSSDLAVQESGLQLLSSAKYLNENYKRSIAKALYDWIEVQTGTAKYQKFTLQAIRQLAKHLNSVEKDKLADTCLDELVTKSGNPGAVELGFSLIKELEIDLNMWTKNLQDIIAAYDIATDDGVKTAIKQGMLATKPSEPSQESAEIWARF